MDPELNPRNTSHEVGFTPWMGRQSITGFITIIVNIIIFIVVCVLGTYTVYALLHLRRIVQSFFLIEGIEGLLVKQTVSGSGRKAAGLHHMRSGYFRGQQMETVPRIQ